ncbi:MAG: CPBP family intramembrane metalloprotease [Myxococcales bacterium]|nr:CPBP family intramembrane metalloprotease [Myxococcales bacterium]MCB9569044.1 CPBP family intramembrane metalloprotease [Myxococcales bacterium]
MGSVRDSATPRPSPAQASTVATFYAVVFLVGFFWHGAAQETNDVWRVDPEQGLVTLLWTPLIGVGFGLAVVKGFRALEARMSWLPALHREFRDLLGEPTIRELLVLAFASSIGEEVLFRGAMLDAWGPWISSLVFAALHVGPKRELWPWTLSSLLLGLCLAALTLWTGNLGAAVAAHFVINLLNLYYITRRPPLVVPRPRESASPPPGGAL